MTSQPVPDRLAGHPFALKRNLFPEPGEVETALDALVEQIVREWVTTPGTLTQRRVDEWHIIREARDLLRGNDDEGRDPPR